MFSGIIKGTGTILESNRSGGDLTLRIGTEGVDLGDVATGDSIAVNGVCLTALRPGSGEFAADVSLETLERTTLGILREGVPVNLEASLQLGQKVDGHLVYGHVDCVGRVAGLEEAGRSTLLTIEVPSAFERYIASKGSIAVDGVSLTVNTVGHNRFSVNIIPHTRAQTVISAYAAGTPVNIECDMVARYVERLLGGISGDSKAANGKAASGSIDKAMLKRYGFIEGE